MKLVRLAAIGSLALAGGSTAASAAPLVPLVAGSETPVPIPVAQGCGLGYSRNAYGRCRPSVFGFGAPRDYGYRYGYERPYRPYGYGYGYRPYGYGY